MGGQVPADTRLCVPRGHIQLYDGSFCDPLNITADDLTLQNIAHSLSMICRFTGHCVHHYSVAQHSWLGALNCDISDVKGKPFLIMEVQRAFLFHDAAEAFLGDMSKPVKTLPGIAEAFEVAEDKIMNAVTERYGLSLDDAVGDAVKRIDARMLFTEKRDILKRSDYAWSGFPEEPIPYYSRVTPMDPDDVKEKFLQLADHLGIKD